MWLLLKCTSTLNVFDPRLFDPSFTLRAPVSKDNVTISGSKWSGSSGKSTKPLDYYRGQARYRVGQSTNLSNTELPPLAKKPSLSYIPVFSSNKPGFQGTTTGPAMNHGAQFGRRAIPGRTDWSSKYNK